MLRKWPRWLAGDSMLRSSRIDADRMAGPPRRENLFDIACGNFRETPGEAALWYGAASNLSHAAFWQHVARIFQETARMLYDDGCSLGAADSAHYLGDAP